MMNQKASDIFVKCCEIAGQDPYVIREHNPMAEGGNRMLAIVAAEHFPEQAASWRNQAGYVISLAPEQS